MKLVLFTDSRLKAQPALNALRAELAACPDTEVVGNDLRIDVDSECYRAIRAKFRPEAPPPAPDFGPGTELAKIITALGINHAGCGGCQAMIDQMNRWGPDKCIENRQQIIDHLKASARMKSLLSLVWAAVKAMSLDFFVNPLDPYRSLVDEAVRRSRDE